MAQTTEKTTNLELDSNVAELEAHKEQLRKALLLEEKNNSKEKNIAILNENLEMFKQYELSKVFNEAGKLVFADNKLRNLIATKNAPLVTFVVGKFFNKRNFDSIKEDLLQEGQFGLLDAIDGFDASLGFKFSTYATYWIRQSCTNYILGKKPIVHIPSHIRTLQNKIIQKSKELNITSKDLLHGNVKELAASFEVTERMLNSVKSAIKSKNVVSLEEPQYTNSEGQKLTLGDLLVTENQETSDDETSLFSDNLIEHNKLIMVAKAAFSQLSDREKYIMLLRYKIIS